MTPPLPVIDTEREAGFTAGPWSLHPRLPGVILGGEAVDVPNGKFQRQVASVNFAPEMNQDQYDANARLIAAAPDLYDALSEAGGYVREADTPASEACLGRILAALSKARTGVPE